MFKHHPRCHQFIACLRAAGNAANIPAREVLDRFGVHVGLLAGRVDAPHVHHARDLGYSEVERGAADHLPHSAVLPVQVFDQTWHLPQIKVNSYKRRIFLAISKLLVLTNSSEVSEWPSLPYPPNPQLYA